MCGPAVGVTVSDAWPAPLSVSVVDTRNGQRPIPSRLKLLPNRSLRN